MSTWEVCQSQSLICQYCMYYHSIANDIHTHQPMSNNNSQVHSTLYNIAFHSMTQITANTKNILDVTGKANNKPKKHKMQAKNYRRIK